MIFLSEQTDSFCGVKINENCWQNVDSGADLLNAVVS